MLVHLTALMTVATATTVAHDNGLSFLNMPPSHHEQRRLQTNCAAEESTLRTCLIDDPGCLNDIWFAGSSGSSNCVPPGDHRKFAQE